MTATATATPTGRTPARPPAGTAPTHTPARRAVPVFALAALLATGQMYTPIPMFGAMEASWNVGLGAMTWIISAFAFGYAGGFLLFGPMADRFGQRRVLVAGLIAAGVVTLLTGLAPTFAAALPLRVLQGLAVGAIPPAMTAYATSRIAPERRAVAVAAIITSFLAATVVGQLASQTAIRFVDWHWVFTGSAVLFGLVAIAASRVMLPDRPAEGASLARSYAAIPRVLRIRELLPMLGAGALSMAAMVAVYTGIELTGVVTGAGGMLALRASALPVMIALPFLAIPLARLDRPAQVVLGAVAAAGAMVAAAFADGHLVVLAILLAVLIGGLGIVAPATTQTAGELGGEHRAAASSVAMFCFYVGATAGPLVARAAAAHGFPGLAWTLAATLLVAAGLALWGKRIQPTRD
ncbi:MFS transporter [Glycomyces sp. A-F 0318]|uniref:MFS transporter n=1 Tax=Glycomyces amatae TaxID=2881355 RepID=UPI001E5327D2|nr:MFS transporter [Glycomyces amatae]MCD0442239.1 MFS transporter [Glycomyces amatae]